MLVAQAKIVPVTLGQSPHPRAGQVTFPGVVDIVRQSRQRLDLDQGRRHVHALFERGQLGEGETVLALGTGGVSIFALQLASAAGARVIVTSSSDEKLERAKELGAAETINYRETEDWDARAWELTEKQGVDHVIEVGGPGTLGRSMNAVGPGGHIALIGVLTGFDAPGDSLFPLVARNVDLHGIYVGSREMFERMNAFLETHQIRPVIDRSFSFDEAPTAYDYLAGGSHFGKVVIEG